MRCDVLHFRGSESGRTPGLFRRACVRMLSRNVLRLVLIGLGLGWGPAGVCQAAETFAWEDWQRVLLLQDAQTRIVMLGTIFLGISGGVVGVFMLLRKRSLIGDVVGHSALPGIALAFLLGEMSAPGHGKSMGALVTGAFVSGLAGALCVMIIDRFSRLRADAALAITLSLFYGAGAALLTLVQRVPSASAAGLTTFLNGKAASLVAADVWVFGLAALGLTVLVVLLFKELALLCFDVDYAATTGWPTRLLDTLLIGMVVAVTVVGMQTVGLILVVAILVIPASSAQFWTDDVRRLTWGSALIGAVSAAAGVMISAAAPRLAAGPVIVLCGSALFVVSFLFGRRHGILWKWLERRRLRQRIGRHDLLRACYELVEAQSQEQHASELELISTRITLEDLLQMRSWSRKTLRQLIHRAVQEDVLEAKPDGRYHLSPDGAALARRAVRNHRLWEMYLITYADTAPAHADYDADRIEHILGGDLVRDLELRLQQQEEQGLPASPHEIPSPSSPGKI